MSRMGQGERMFQTPDMVIYHDDCLDGFGAAWAIWKRFPAIRFIAARHGQPPPEGLTGHHILMVDFTYPRDVLEAIAGRAASLLVLDHHVTAREALAGLPFVRFEEEKSGAVMAWEWAHQSRVPLLLRYVEDKDLWRWRLPMSREVAAALASYPYDFQVWDALIVERLQTEGIAILRYEDRLVEAIASQAILVSFHGSTVPCVQSHVLRSRVGERLGRGYPFCIVWYERDGRRYYSLRSAPDGADVGRIAVSYGGGGHTHAASFTLPIESAASLLTVVGFRLPPYTGTGAAC